MLNRANNRCSSLPGWQRAQYSLTVRKILRLSETLGRLTDDEIRKWSSDLRWKARCGISLLRIMPTAYALVREASRRAYELEHYPVQLTAGIVMANGGIAEMATGEGKTLTAVAPACLYALAGRGCHVLTSNDYLAGRDAEFARPILERLGITTGSLQNNMQPNDRRNAYACDVTYGTEKEMGFDFLRDRLQSHGMTTSSPGDNINTVQRGHFFAIVDEADSIMVDQARTPLLIAEKRACSRENAALLKWCDQMARGLQQEEDFRYQPDTRATSLTRNGCRRVLLEPRPQVMAGCDTDRVYQQVERAIAAKSLFAADRDYVVTHGTLQIIDESTGRVLDGRKWQDGLHQAIEVKEQLAASEMTHETARITVQSYLNQYRHLAGMTGTAIPVRRELKRVFGVTVAAIPTNRPCRRATFPTRIFLTLKQKLDAVVDSIQQNHAAGRAILIGTPSVSASEALSAKLRASKLPHRILHARHDAEEASIIAAAGQQGSIVVATNMAGRGTDIKITDKVRELGGLHVIATELHSSARIDRQLAGRAARQGDPGSYQAFVSLQDELIQSLPRASVRRIIRNVRGDAAGELSGRYLRTFEKARSRLERLHEMQRRQLLKHEKQTADTCKELGLDPWLESFDMNQNQW